MLTHGWNLSLFTAALNKNWDNRRASFYGDPVAALDSDVNEEEKKTLQWIPEKLLIFYLHEKAREWTQYLTEWRRPQEQESVIDQLIYYFLKLVEIRKLK